jgi:hypothetical protein
VTMEDALKVATSPHDFKLLVAAHGRTATSMDDLKGTDGGVGPQTLTRPGQPNNGSAPATATRPPGPSVAPGISSATRSSAPPPGVAA